MAAFPMPEMPAHGSPVSANWGRKVVECLRRLRPVAGTGMKMDYTPNGTVYSSEPGLRSATGSELKPFTIRWMPHGDGDDDGEWQIYLPLGCVSVKVRNAGTAAYASLCLNDRAKDADGNDIHGWYRIDEPTGSEGLVERIGGTAYQSFPVYVLEKPWPRFKVSCDKDAFGTVAGRVSVGTINVAKASGGTARKGIRIADGPMTVEDVDAHAERMFNIVYEFDEGKLYDKGAKPKVKVVNQLFAGGRTVVGDAGDEADIAGWEWVWLVITHDGSASDLKIELSSSDGGTDTEKTSIPLYRLKDDIVVSDTRSLLEKVRFYDT